MVQSWAVKHVSQLIAREGDEVTKSNVLQSRTMALDKTFILGFSLVGLYRKLSIICPVTTALFHSLSTTPRQQLSMNDNTEQRKQHVSTHYDYSFATILTAAGVDILFSV